MEISSFFIASAIKNEIPQVELVGRLYNANLDWGGSTILTTDKSKIEKQQSTTEYKFGKMIIICDIYVNSAIDAWNVIKKYLTRLSA